MAGTTTETDDRQPGDPPGESRRAVLARLGLGALVAAGVAAGAPPAGADQALDVQILQTASSLEQLLVDTYNRYLATNPLGVLDLPGAAGQVVRTFLTATIAHHEEHRRSFQERTRGLGGKEQTAPNPKFQLIVDSNFARFRNPVDVLDFAALLEKIVTDTYLTNLTLLESPVLKADMAAVMGVEAQHAASLRTVSALLKADAAALVKIPLGADVAAVPRTAGSAAFPEALHTVGNAELIAQPETGAVP